MRVEISKGESLIDALRKKNITIDTPCGGNGSCGGCKVKVKKFGEVRACKFRLPGEYEVQLPMQRQFCTVGIEDVLSLQEVEGDLVRIAVDVGSTTIAILAITANGTYSRSFINPQRRYGADVLSRIRAAEEGQLSAMQEILSERLDAMLADLLAEIRQKEQRKVEGAVVCMAANTTMLHLYNGWSCEGLGKAPFSPVSLDLQEFNGYLTDLEGIEQKESDKEGEVRFHNIHLLQMPGISTFVGADIVSGIFALKMHESKEVNLLIDLGTNGEMAIGNRDRLLVASTAAGPAFEGSELSVQIHGAGVLKCIHKLAEQNKMDETGLLGEPYFEEGVLVDELLEKKTVGNLRITQEDIREIQMAKAAVRAGIDILIREYGVAVDAISHVYLAGGMGYYLDTSDAIAVGLIPEEFKKKTVPAGNTALLGAARFLLGDEEEGKDALKHIVEMTEEISLAEHPDFGNCYFASMNF